MNEIESYNDGRPKKVSEPISGLLVEYAYSGNSRISTITNERNKSNFKSVLTEELIGDRYVTLESEEFGDTYHIIKKYSKKGEEFYYNQTNLKTNKVYKKITKWQDGNPCIWTSEYGEEKSVGFYLQKSILTGLTKNF